MKSIAGSTNAAIMALVAARSRGATAFQPSFGRLFSSASAATGRRGSSAYMYGLATATSAALVGASSRWVHALLEETMVEWTERERGGEAEGCEVEMHI